MVPQPSLTLKAERDEEAVEEKLETERLLHEVLGKSHLHSTEVRGERAAVWKGTSAFAVR